VLNKSIHCYHLFQHVEVLRRAFRQRSTLYSKFGGPYFANGAGDLRIFSALDVAVVMHLVMNIIW
jgi:hypothetical protein